VRVLVTGSGGYIGRAFCTEAAMRGVQITAVSRKSNQLTPYYDNIFKPSIDGDTNWGDELNGCQVVVHLAGIVHNKTEKWIGAEDYYHKVNVEGSCNLASCAAAYGVKRFIFISSIGVCGSLTKPNEPFRAEDPANPQSLYAKSKFEAENALKVIAKKTGMELVIIRPPLVYGPEAPGNFSLMLLSLNYRIPLPLKSVSNARSFISLDNLVDFIYVCLYRKDAANNTFLVSDDEDVSTKKLLMLAGHLIGKPARLFSINPYLLRLFLILVGQRKMAHSLLGNMQIDITKTRNLLNWTPPLSFAEGLLKAIK
jgi:nucleoside-diphosphate-sugar epimerase